MSTVISVENISKQYRLGEVGTGTLSHDFNRWWHKVRGKEDPYLMVGDTNDRSKKGDSEYSWALRDVSFEVKQGEVLGIIGRNGAGKSTLLKILSRVTQPTTGEIKVKGRIASLLEVGTGFHPELSGRENIFLNGAILGMRKHEITRKLDEIIEFSGCERYIDTPVKRYSSGMYVRLAFAVAAHLEPEILIIDEVLAVGDAEFQKRCIGKIQDVAHAGKTVIFVSHQMPSVSRLTEKCIVMSNGCISYCGLTKRAIEIYLDINRAPTSGNLDISQLPRIGVSQPLARLIQIGFVDKNTFNVGEDIVLQFKFIAATRLAGIRLSMTILTKDSTPIGCTVMEDDVSADLGESKERLVCLSSPNLAPGNYYCIVALGSGGLFEEHVDYDIVPDVLNFEVKPIDSETGKGVYWGSGWGHTVLPNLQIVDLTR